MESIEFVDFVFVVRGSPKTEPRNFYTKLHKALGADALAITVGDPNIQARKKQIETAGGELITISPINNDSTTSLICKFLDETAFLIQYAKESTTKEYATKSLIHWEQLEFPLDYKNQDNSK